MSGDDKASVVPLTLGHALLGEWRADDLLRGLGFERHLPAVEERGRSSPRTGLRRRVGDFVAEASRGRFSAARERQDI
jgi:hypothetical protein